MSILEHVEIGLSTRRSEGRACHRRLQRIDGFIWFILIWFYTWFSGSKGQGQVNGFARINGIWVIK